MEAKAAKTEVQSQLISEVTSFFEAFLQAEIDLFERKIGDLRYWHFIRFQFFDEVIAAKNWIGKSSPFRQASWFEKISIGLDITKNSLLYPIGRDRKQTQVLVLNSADKFQKNGRFVDRYTDPWLGDFEKSYTVWEDHLSWRHKKHGANPKLFFLDSLHLRALLNRLMGRIDQQTINDQTRFLVTWARQFGVELSSKAISQIIANVVALHQCGVDSIRKQIIKKQVKLIVLVNHYDPLKMLITSLAKPLGIYVVELQHGNMGRYHIGYNFNHAMKLDTLPHEILTFGRFWNETTRIRQNGVRLTSVGMPYFEEKGSQMSVSSEQEKTRILILSQAAIGQKLGHIALGLSNRLNKAQFEIIYKLHPREYENWKLTYPKEFVHSGIKVLTHADLYRLLAQTDVHIGVYSTTIIESLAFNKKLILVESYGVHYFTDLIKSGRAFFAKNTEDVLKAIHAPRPENSKIHDLTYYWERNSKAKLIQRLEELLGEAD